MPSRVRRSHCSSQRGYDAVSIAEIAAAADVSRRTLFAYFPTKDDLVLHRFADHEDEAARVVRAREPDVAPLDALHAHLRAALERRDPVTGLCDDPRVVRFYRLVLDTPALSAALVRYQARGEHALATALDGAEEPSLTARLAAGQILVVLRTLGHENQMRIAAGRSCGRPGRGGTGGGGPRLRAARAAGWRRTGAPEIDVSAEPAMIE